MTDETPRPLPATRSKVRVEYEDGSTVEFNPNKPLFLLAMERKFKVQEPETHEQLYWLAWYALGSEPKLGPFNDWVKDVEYVLPVRVDDGEANPGEAPPS